MNVKNLNPLERHVEKIVLAVAAAGALYIGYLAIQPITVPDAPTPVTASQVEPAVTAAVASLNEVREKTQHLQNLTPRLQNYVQEYQNLVQRQPLKPDLVSAAAVPQFAPLQEGIGAVGQGGDISPESHMQVVTPTVPPPRDVTAVATRATVSLVPPLAPGAEAPPPPAPGTPLPPDQTKDLNWVTISGRIPMADFIAEMNAPDLQPNQRLTPPDQRSVLYRIEVQRRSRDHGAWSAWQPVAPTKANGDPIALDWAGTGDADLPAQVAALDSLFRKIAEPDFYTLATGGPFIPPILTQPDASTTKPAAAGVTPPGAPNPNGPTAAQIAAQMAAARGGRPPVAPPQMNDDGGPAPAAVAAVPGMPDLTQLRTLPSIPFWFFDENVVPNQEYQYEVRIVMYNPTYRFSLGLKNPAMKNQPTIASEWAVIPEPVTVSSDLYFFVDSGMGGAGAAAATTTMKVGFRIFKWTNGNWYGTEGTAQPGEPITGTVHLLDKGNIPVDVDTGYRLVDVLPTANGSDLNTVLLAPNGDLVIRGSKSDRAGVNTVRQEREKDVVKPVPVPVVPKVKPVIHLPGNNPQIGDQ
jgi:hypothetical protein